MTDDIITHYLTRDEAIKFVKKHRRGRQCYVRIGTFGYTQLPDEDDNARGYDLSGLVPVGAMIALRAIADMISDPFAEKGVRIRIAISHRCLFVG